MGEKTMRNIMFLCTGNSCRSQMAEGWARSMAPEGVGVYSAGISPQGVHPRAVEVMKEAGIDISDQSSDSVDDYDLDAMAVLVTLCGDARENCPLVPGTVKTIHWPLPDPARAEGTEEEVLQAFREVRDVIRERVMHLLHGELG